MPIYEGDQYTYEQLSDLCKRNVCAECGGQLSIFMDGDTGKTFLACTDWRRTHHEGIERESSRWEKEGMASLNIETRREKMEQEHGTTITTALEKARMPTTGALTQPQAMHILKLVYPKAPEDEIIRCALLCRDFGLHPLMKEVYLIPFKEKSGRDNYVTVLGIGATRKMMSRQGTYSYLDNTPRVMTQKEQEAIFGEVDGANIVAITKLKTRAGEEAQGYGKWPKSKEPYGTDKGNTKANMAFIRSERNAFGRLFSDALPQGIEVIDEAYVEVPDVGKVSTSTGEITEGEFTELGNGNETPLEPTPATEEHWCQEHNCAFEEKKGKYGSFYAHATPKCPEYPKGWCNEKKNNKTKPESEPELSGLPPDQAAEAYFTPPEPEPQEPELDTTPNWAPGDEPFTEDSSVEPDPQEPSPNTIEALKETMQLCNWSAMQVGHFCAKVKSWEIREYKDLKPDQLAEVIAHIKNNAK